MTCNALYVTHSLLSLLQYGLRQLDLSLLSQLWSLNESIQEFRQLLQDEDADGLEGAALSPPSPTSPASPASPRSSEDDLRDLRDADELYDLGGLGGLGGLAGLGLQGLQGIQVRGAMDFLSNRVAYDAMTVPTRRNL